MVIKNWLATWVAAIRQDDRAPTKGLGSLALAGRLGTGSDSHHSKHEPRSWLSNAFNLSPYFILRKISSWIGFLAKLHPSTVMLWNLHKLQHQKLGGKKCQSSSPSIFLVYNRAVDDVPSPSVFLAYLANMIHRCILLPILTGASQASVAVRGETWSLRAHWRDWRCRWMFCAACRRYTCKIDYYRIDWKIKMCYNPYIWKALT